MPDTSLPPIQPTGLHNYLNLKQEFNLLPSVSRYFYASWEDGLWDLLLNLKIKPESTALVPEFFCQNVVTNMEAHGLKIIWYPCDRFFRTDPNQLLELITAHSPAVLVILHAVGITNPLWSQTNDWLPSLPKSSLLIEDSVHRVVDPAKITLLHPRHVVMDSLRKVSPLVGSNLYISDQIKIIPTAWQQTWQYQLQVYGWYLIFQMFLSLQTINISLRWQNFCNQRAELVMLRSYDVIGDSKLSGAGWPIFDWLSKKIDHTKIAQTKVDQVKYYLEHLASAWRSQSIYQIPIHTSDFGRLRGYPIGIESLNASKVISSLREKGLLLRLELDPSPWSKKQKVIYLPLGPHLSADQISWSCKTLLSAIIGEEN